jgi:hypothetical protein
VQQKKNEEIGWKESFNIVFSLLCIHKTALVVPFRNRWGVEAMGTPCLWAFGLLVVYAAFCLDPFMWMWVAAWVICQIRNRIEAARLSARGVRTHSCYDGWPASACRIPFIRNEDTAKLVVEPLLVMGIGLGCWWASSLMHSPPGLARFFLWGGVTLPAVETIKQARWARRLRMLDDARMEQEGMMRTYRDKFGDS